MGDEIKDKWNEETDEIKKDVDGLGDEGNEIKEEFENIIPEIEDEMQTANGDVGKYMNIFRWILNQVLVTLPHALICFLAIVYNFWWNIAWNNGWAEGNFYLLFNTLFLEWQSVLSILLVAEFPFWLKHGKIIRMISLFSAMTYITIYFFALLDWLYVMFLKTPNDQDILSAL